VLALKRPVVKERGYCKGRKEHRKEDTPRSAEEEAPGKRKECGLDK